MEKATATVSRYGAGLLCRRGVPPRVQLASGGGGRRDLLREARSEVCRPADRDRLPGAGGLTCPSATLHVLYVFGSLLHRSTVPHPIPSLSRVTCGRIHPRQVSTVAGVHPKPLGLRELATFVSGLIVFDPGGLRRRTRRRSRLKGAGPRSARARAQGSRRRGSMSFCCTPLFL